MALPICLEIPEIPDPFAIPLPGGVTLQQINALDAVQSALAPLMPLFDIVDTIVAVFNCIKAIPDALGPPPDPTVLAACLPELAQAIGKLLRLVPQLSLPRTVVAVIDLVIDTLQQARTQLVHLQAQLQRVARAVDRATQLQDAGLMAITNCAKTNIAQETFNLGKALASLGKLIGFLNVLLGMLGAPSVPDLAPLAGQPLDQVLVAIDAIVASFQTVRRAIPLP